MKDDLLQQHTLTKYQRIERLLAVGSLASRRFTQLLAEMMELCPDDEEASCFFISFLQRLPAWLRVQLEGDIQDDIRRLATRADRLSTDTSMAGLSPLCKARRMKTRSPVQGGRRNAEEHAVHLRQLFTRLREHGLVINVEKCVFGAPSIQFLGHCRGGGAASGERVGGDGVPQTIHGKRCKCS